MTDYLEALLEQVEQDEEGGLPEWRRPSRAVYAGAGGKDASDGGGETQLRAEGTGTAQTHSLNQPEEQRYQERLSVERLEQLRREREPVMLIQRMEQLRRAVRQGLEQAGYRSAAAQAAQPGAAGGLWDLSLPARRAADYAAAVDAAFQRDARRYDGPLGLL